MIEPFNHNPPALPDGDCKMVTTIGRDPSWTHRAMAELFAAATKQNFSPVLWEIGFFNLRDLEAAHDPHFRGRPYSRNVETAWGCGITVVDLQDRIALLAQEIVDGKTRFERFQARET